MLEIVAKLESRLTEIDTLLADPATMADQATLIALNRERRQVEEKLAVGRVYRTHAVGITEAKELIASETDSEMVEMAREELRGHEEALPDIEREFKFLLLPRDPADDKAAMVEIRAGTGGDEAAIFAGDIYRMYERYAEQQGWKIDIVSSSPSESGGFKEIICSISGDNVFGRMKYEGGVHRVQRVPATETQGRIHTSAVSVAILPEAEEVDIQIHENDLKVDVYRSSGPGGQSVNTTDSAVRMTHIPTGLVVTCQDEKSQIKNKAKALKVLRSRLYERELAEQRAKIDAERRDMVSTGDRSAKIRTYNYPQQRVTDHRINLTLYKLDEVINGDLDAVIEPLIQHDRESLLAEQSSTVAT